MVRLHKTSSSPNTTVAQQLFRQGARSALAAYVAGDSVASPDNIQDCIPINHRSDH